MRNYEDLLLNTSQGKPVSPIKLKITWQMYLIITVNEKLYLSRYLSRAGKVFS